MAGIKKNLIATTYGMAVITLGQFALVPLFLDAWGPAQYGQWLVLFAVPAYLSLTDIGIGHALGNLLSISVEQGRKQEASRLLGAALRFQGLFALAVFASAVACALTLPLTKWLKIEALNATSAATALICLVAYSLVPIQIGCLAGIYRASSSYPRFLLIQGHSRLAEIVCTACMLLSGKGMVALSAALLAVRLGWFTIVTLDSKDRVNGVDARWSDGEWSDFRTLVPIGFGYFAFPVGNALINQGVLLVVNHFGGAIAVVVLNVCRQASRLYMQMTSALSASLHPEMTIAFARGDTKRLLTLQASGVAFVLACGAAAVLALALGGPALVHWWTGKLIVTHVTAGLIALESVTAGIANILLLPLWAASRLGNLPGWFLGAQAVGLLCVCFTFPMLNVATVGLFFATVNIAFGLIAWTKVLELCGCSSSEFASYLAEDIKRFTFAALRRLVLKSSSET